MSDDTKTLSPVELKQILDRRSQYKMAALNCWPLVQGETPDPAKLAEFASLVADAMLKEDDEAERLAGGVVRSSGVFLRAKYRK